MSTLSLYFGGTFGNFRLLIDYFGLHQSSFQLTITTNALHREHLKAFANSFKHCKINKHSRYTSGVLSVTIDHYH